MLQHPAHTLIALLAGGVLLAAPTLAAAQSATPVPAAAATSATSAAAAVATRAAQAPRSELRLQHSFPLAGKDLLIVIDGLLPGEPVLLNLLDAAQAPPSVTRFVSNPPASSGFRGQSEPAQVGALTTLWAADELGRVVLSIPLTDPGDVEREIQLQAVRYQALGRSKPLALRVEPPMIVLPGPTGLQRINLLTGAALQPAIPGEGGLRGLALSDTGTQGYLLREGGRLEVLATHPWDAPPLSVRALDPSVDTLAALAGGGAAFVLARPRGEPFAPAARMLFVQDEHQPVLLEPMVQPVSGHRVALTEDGLTAFVAEEDDLIVREVDLQTGTARGLITAGLAGDRAIADVILAGGRLLVATRGPLGRHGALTVYDLDTGAIVTLPLAVDPLRLVALEHGIVLAVPAAGDAFQIVESGEPTRLGSVPGVAAWLDAAPSDDGALLLAAASDGSRSLLHYDPLTGAFGLQLQAAPPASRLAGTGPVVLLGDPSGQVHVFDAATGKLTTLADVIAAPDAPFVVLP